MKAFLSKRAARTAERIDARWRDEGDDSGIFAREFLAAIETLEASNGIAPQFPTARHPDLRRVLLPKSRVHIYFDIDEQNRSSECSRWVRRVLRFGPGAPQVRETRLAPKLLYLWS